MGKKQLSKEEELVVFGYTADESTLTTTINMLVGLRNIRFPKQQAKVKTARKPRSDSGKPRGLPKDDDKSNGGDNDAPSAD